MEVYGDIRFPMDILGNLILKQGTMTSKNLSVILRKLSINSRKGRLKKLIMPS